MKRTVIFTMLPAILGGLAVTGCGPEQQTPKVTQTAPKKYVQATMLEGTVSDNKGLVKTAKLEAANESGQIVAETTVDNGHYNLEIPAGTVLPMLLTVTPEGETEKLTVAVIHNSITKYDINPLTTKIAKAAKTMGGYTHGNLTRAAEETVHVPESNKTTTGWRGDPTKQYGGWH